ncbi:PREDICTED: spermatogenesis-associated protein 31E1-like [Odobenus rosmarus divergens]|uniref:Spermatogenesis-associated protein 31E1-like n=1 Tax=Odobenus rosmarus divergens TaxID=9708 RepID=A0A9B0HI62_ODORO
MEGRGAHPPDPPAPGFGSHLLSPTATWRGSLTRGTFSSYIKRPLGRCAEQCLLEPISHAGSCDSVAPPLRPIPQSSSPHTPWLASSVPAISGLGRSSCPISALSWWQAAPKTWSLSTSTRLESHQEPLAHRPPEALFWGDPTHRQGETGIPPFINLDIQKLLEILIAKRTDLKIQKEKEEKEESDCHLTSFGRMFKSPGDKQDTMGDQHFWSLRDKPKQLLSPEKPPHPKTLGDNLQQKCNQLFWGLPFLHSESLVATVSDGQDPQGHGSVSVLPRDLIDPELRKQLEWHLWKKFMKHQSGLPRRIQLSVKPHREFQKVPQAIRRHRPASESDSTDGSCQATQKTGSRYPARTMPRKSLGKDSRSTAGRIRKDLHKGSASSPGKAPGINSEESDTDLKPSTSSADKKHPEKVLRAHLGRKLGQIREGQIPADVHRSRLAAHHALDLLRKPSTHGKTGKPAFSKGWEPYRTTSHNFSILSPYTQQMLEAHIIRFRVKHRWSLPLKVLKPINLFKLKKSFFFPRSSTTRLATCVSKACSKTKFLGKPPQPHQGEKVAKESYPTLGSPLPAPQPTCEEIHQALQGTSPRDGRGPSEAPLAGQEARSPSQTLTYSFVGRIWHREPASGTLMNSNLESSPSPATSEPRRESGGRASQDSCYSIKVLELNLESQYLSARESREAGEVEEAPAWGVTLEPRVWANNQTSRADLRRSGSSEKSDSPSPPTELVTQDPEELCFDAQFREFELRKLMESENQPQDNAASVLLQDCETGVLLQDCATDSLLQDCQSDVFLAADILASQGSLSDFQSGSREDTSTSQVLYGLRSSGQKIQRQPEPLGLRDQYKSRRKSSVPTAEREYYYRRPSRREPEKELSALKILQISEMSHTAQHKDAAESSGSKACPLLLKKEMVPPESYFRRGMRHFIQCFSSSKGKGLEDSLQKGKSSSSRSRRPVTGRSTVDSATAKAQVLMTAVGQILQEKMVPHHGVRAPEFSWCQRDLQASAGPNVCYHRVLSYQEQRRVMRKTASNQQATPKGHSYANKTEWIRSRDKRPSGGELRGPVAVPAGSAPHSSCRAQVERSPPQLPHRGSGGQRQQGLRAGKLNFCTIC